MLSSCSGGRIAGALVDAGRVEAVAVRRSALLEELRRLSGNRQAQLVKSTVDLGRIARVVVGRFRREEPLREVELVIQEPLIAIGDGALLAVVLEHLIGNAWKFTGRTPHGMIRVSGAPRDGRSVYCVSDNGAGFDQARSGRLFQPFQRLHRAEEFPGAGVGLAIAQSIVHRHGGRIWAEGQVGGGATFRFTL